MKRYLNINPDAAGAFASILCAIHCSAVPIMISLGVLSSASWLHDHLFDWVIIGVGIVIAGYSLVGDYLRHHHNLQPLFLATIGFLFLGIGMIQHEGWLLVLSIAGGLIVAMAHYKNHLLGRATCSHSEV